jgi:hypothetical protein
MIMFQSILNLYYETEGEGESTYRDHDFVPAKGLFRRFCCDTDFELSEINVNIALLRKHTKTGPSSVLH